MRFSHGVFVDYTNHLKVAENAILLVQKLLKEKGPLRLEGDLLKAGDFLLNEDTTLVDAVYDATLFGSTIFLGNVRIATRASFKGCTAPAYGSTANDEVTELVLHQGETFRGQTRTLERDWIIIYTPLDDDTGKRIGMIAAFRELKSF